MKTSSASVTPLDSLDAQVTELSLIDVRSLRPDAAERERLVRRARLLAWAGNGWHLLEFAIALAAGIAASSIALVGFGIDSLIEALAAFTIIWRFGESRAHLARPERRAQQLIAAGYVVLAAYIAVEAARTLAGGSHPEVSGIGIALAAVTAATMPLLARAKQRVGRQLASSATVSEGAQNMLCAYLSIALLLGLGANAMFGWWWADPVAALFIAALAVREGRESWRGERCDCC